MEIVVLTNGFMRLTIETQPFMRMVEEVCEMMAKGHKSNMARLIACRGRLFLEGNTTVAETAADVAEEGQCKVPLEKLAHLLKTCADEQSVTVEADTTWLRCGISSIPVSGYSTYAVPPTRSHVYQADEAGVTPSKFLLDSLA